MHTRLIVLLASVSLAALITICESADKPVDARQQQRPSRVQPKEPKDVVPAAAEVSDEAKQTLVQLRGKFPNKTDDEIIRVLCGYCSGDESASDGTKWFAERLKRAREQGRARELVRKSGGWTRCQRDRFADLPMSRTEEPSQPAWLRTLMGADFFDSVVVCELRGPETGDPALEPLDQLPQLDWLSVSGGRDDYAPLGRTQVSDAGLEHLRRLTHLRNLYLHGSRITDAGLANIAGLLELECISLGDTGITDTGLQHFERLRRLQDLYLGDTRITGSGLKHLQGLTRLERLDLRNCPLVAENLKWLQPLPIHELNLDGCRDVADTGLQHLRPLSQLYHLSLEDTAITDAGLEHLKGLGGLRWLLLRKTKVTDKGLEHLQRLTRLECLGLDECAVTDAGLQHLRGLSGLELLYLSRTKVTDAGLVHLRGLNQIWELTLCDCPVTDAGLEYLKTLAKLRFLHVQGTKVTEHGVKKLQHALPNCMIEWEPPTRDGR